jgi:itaconyl-CoA hydratase
MKLPTAYFQGPEGLLHERFGLAPDELYPGLRIAHRPGITMSQQENVDEALDSINSAMVHYDEAYASHTSWKRPLVVSTLTLQRLIGMGSKSLGRRRRISRMDSVAMKKPVFGGDTLYAESEVLAVGPAQAQTTPVHLRTVGLNQHGQVVAELVYHIDMWNRDCGPDLLPPGCSPATDPRFASHHLRDDEAWVEQVGLYFEDLAPGESFVHWPRRSLYAEETTRRVLRSLEMQPILHDLSLQAELLVGRPAVPETWVLTLAAAASTRTLGRVTANLGWTDIEFLEDVQIGDTLQSQSTILETRASGSRPDEGIATVRTEACNQRGQVVVRFQRTLLVYRSSAPNPYADAGY